jgi:hypothetical protein
LFLLLLAACRDEKPPKAVNEMIESPLQNTVISSFDTYPPRPAVETDSHSVLTARAEAEEGAQGETEVRFWCLLPL